MKLRILQTWLWLLMIDIAMVATGVRLVYWAIRRQPVSIIAPTKRVSSSALSRALDLACVFYFKEVKCLQRSAVATLLLRRHGWKAEMVLGVQLIPFKNHAWVEVDGEVVNDKPYIREMYQVLDRC
jgi:hypothetical protein